MTEIGIEVIDYWQWDDRDTSVIFFVILQGSGCWWCGLTISGVVRTLVVYSGRWWDIAGGQCCEWLKCCLLCYYFVSLVTIYVLICNVKCYGWICSVVNILLPCTMITLLGDLIYIWPCVALLLIGFICIWELAMRFHAALFIEYI